MLLRFLFSSLLSHPRRSPLNSQGLLHTSSSLSYPRPRHPPSPSLSLILVPRSLRQHLPSFHSPILPPTPLNTEPLRSMDLPWISPGSPLRLTDTHLRVLPFSCFPCFTFVSAPLLLSHLILLLSLILCITINFFSH